MVFWFEAWRTQNRCCLSWHRVVMRIEKSTRRTCVIDRYAYPINLISKGLLRTRIYLDMDWTGLLCVSCRLFRQISVS